MSARFSIEYVARVRATPLLLQLALSVPVAFVALALVGRFSPIAGVTAGLLVLGQMLRSRWRQASKRGALVVENGLIQHDGVRLTAEQSTFRHAAATADELWSVVESTDSSPRDRAAAVVALHRHLDDEGRARLRRLARASASPVLDEVLELATVEVSAEFDRRVEPSLASLSA